MSTLEGLSVLDLSRYLSGPTAAMMLGDLGADVIKVEAAPAGDPARQSGPFQDGESVYYMASNRNKRSLAVDARDPSGRALLRRLASRADVLIENFRPGTIAAMGLGAQDLAALNPRLVHCSISGFGQQGPGRDLPGFDQTAQAMTGLMSVTGDDRTGPMRVGIAICDSASGVMAAYGIMTKLYERERTGVGGTVETSLMQTGIALMSYQAQTYLSLGQVPGRNGNDHPIMFPQGTFAARDGSVTIASGNERMWRSLAGVLGLPHLAEDERYATNEGRMRDRAELRTTIEAVLATEDAQTWIDRISAAGIPCGPVYDVAQALDHPISAALGMVGQVEHPRLGELDLVGPGVRTAGPGQAFDGREGPGARGGADGAADPDREWLRRPPPMLGEHSREVAAEAGLEAAEVDELVARGVLVAPGG